ncbi:hypothetical protein UFOVP253_63 [uncultured Caudovirales phage]|uniref:Helix-turn-helix domain containing protein n=1 Tax=uncultured Caudovirales phage TaxID=2100421 RepID=A0A6J5LDJ5_9CAUD|nr:hypothetical protein UFOVP253_63 [uncultured Caudovirales phage]
MDETSSTPIQTTIPKYATLLYEVRAQLDISWSEYVYLDMVYHLSHDGWCFKSLENIGKDLGMHKSSVVYMRDRLIHRKLLVKNKQGYVKTSVMYQKLVLTDEKPYQKLNAPYQKHVFAVPKSGTKNNIRATLDYKRPQKIVDKFGIETLQSMEARIKARAK